MTVEQLQAELDRLDDGILRSGSHDKGRRFCALEFESQLRGRSWSDIPVTLPDIRPLNDGPWSSDRARTNALLPLMSALWDWSKWTPKRRIMWTQYIVLNTIQQIISRLPSLSSAQSAACANSQTLMEAAVGATEAAEAARAAMGVEWAAAEAAKAAWAIVRVEWAAAEAAMGATEAAEAAEAAKAAWATEAARTARAAARAARVAAEVARAAAKAVGNTDADNMLTRVCAIWVAGVAATENL